MKGMIIMIYSDDINRICALCVNADFLSENNDSMYCRIKKVNVDKSHPDCGKFKYDIFKKPVRRKKRLKTDFSADDFKL